LTVLGRDKTAAGHPRRVERAPNNVRVSQPLGRDVPPINACDEAFGSTAHDQVQVGGSAKVDWLAAAIDSVPAGYHIKKTLRRPCAEASKAPLGVIHLRRYDGPGEPETFRRLPERGNHEDTSYPSPQRKRGSPGIGSNGYMRGIDVLKDLTEAARELL
jgi:hypothetical protein